MRNYLMPDVKLITDIKPNCDISHVLHTIYDIILIKVSFKLIY